MNEAAGGREEPCAPAPVPPDLTGELRGYDWSRNTVGQSGGTVYRLHGKPGAPDLYLKHGCAGIVGDLLDEVGRLHWLAGHVAVPAVRYFVTTGVEAWLLMTALPGRTAYQALASDPANRPAIVDALADFLRAFHAIPISACPFTSDAGHRMGLARQRIDAGLVDEGDFDDERQGWSAEQVWTELQNCLPLAPDPVVTHGDYSLDNLLIVDGAVTGCIDAGRVGIADRYQDLAIMWNCLAEFGGPLQDRFLARYGAMPPDECKLRFHLLLDELF